jgi:hypothetical protein
MLREHIVYLKIEKKLSGAIDMKFQADVNEVGKSLNDFYFGIDDFFIEYAIPHHGAKCWKESIEECEKKIKEPSGYQMIVDGHDDSVYVCAKEPFKIQTTLKRLKPILERSEGISAKDAVNGIKNLWETFKQKLKKLGVDVQDCCDIWYELPCEEIDLTPARMDKLREDLENWYTEFLVKKFSPSSR